MEAQLKYLPQKYEEIVPGTYVLCAVTGEKIDIEELRYWNPERQEAYKDAKASLQRELEIRKMISNVGD